MIIKKVQLKNFKCYGSFEAEFAPGINTISGRNASGKTSMADAIAWVFFGTDCLGNNNPPVRRDGTADEEDVSVSIETDAGTYAKSQSRTRKGDGYSDSNTFSVNGLKAGKAEFEARFAEYRFAMLPGAFLSQPQDRMRRELFNKFCPVDEATAAKNAKLRDLAKELQYGSLEQITDSQKKMAASAKKEIAATAQKIDELEQLIMEREEIPYSDMELEKAELLRVANMVSEPCPTCGAETSTEAKECLERIAEIDRDFAKKDVSAEEARAHALRKIRAELVGKQAAADKLVFQGQQLDRIMSETCSEEVRTAFRRVEWEFTAANKSGEVKNACIPTIDGRSILDGSANKAARLAGKVDICLAFGGGNIPVIIDDAESLDRESLLGILKEITCQVILLKVTNEKELHIKKGA